jgi:hypothetical protein
VTDELTSEQEAAVRRLLAEARHDAPVPADVAARLDEVLDGLVADEGVDDLEVFESDTSQAGGSGSVTQLAGVRRRRRNAGRLLLAAAAVVVGGVAVGQSVGDSGLSGGDAADQGTALSEAPRDGGDNADQDAGGGEGEATVPEAAEPVAPDEQATTTSGQAYLLDKLAAPLELSSDTFAADVRRELARTAAERRHAASSNFDGVTAYAQANPDFMCSTGAYGEGATLPAYYDAEEAVLVLRRPQAGLQRVDLLTCGTAVPLDSVELPAP